MVVANPIPLVLLLMLLPVPLVLLLLLLWLALVSLPKVVSLPLEMEVGAVGGVVLSLGALL